MKRTVVFVCLGLLGWAGWLVLHGDVEVSPEMIAERCRQSEPSWESYQEDIKGQIGAGPVAEWAGEPAAVTAREEEVTVDFALQAPWRDYDAALPVLLRDSFGSTCPQVHTEHVDGVRRYHFSLMGEALKHTPSWFEIRYPHGEDWLPLDNEGRWRRNGGDAGEARPSGPRRRPGTEDLQ